MVRHHSSSGHVQVLHGTCGVQLQAEMPGRFPDDDNRGRGGACSARAAAREGAREALPQPAEEDGVARLRQADGRHDFPAEQHRPGNQIQLLGVRRPDVAERRPDQHPDVPGRLRPAKRLALHPPHRLLKRLRAHQQ